MNKYLILAPCVILLLSSPTVLAGTDWTEDVTAALEQAKSQNKDVLIDFTGSDWCGWCIKLDEEVFSQDAFKERAPEDFVLVKLDFPNEKPQSEELKAQNQAWAQKLGVEGFPTIALVDAEGTPYAMTGYQRGGAEAYMEHLDELRQRRIDRDEMLAEADNANGVEKAKYLDAALEAIGMELAGAHYNDTVEQIVLLDPDDEAGLKSKYETVLKAGMLDAEMQAVMGMLQSGQTEQAIARIETLIGDGNVPGEMQVEMRMVQAQISAMQGQTDKAVAYFNQAIEAAPDPAMADQLRQILGAFKAEFEVDDAAGSDSPSQPDAPPAP